ncbi:hypothetical protein ACH49_14375, partial [Streptomyces leeuwenhoekii]
MSRRPPHVVRRHEQRPALGKQQRREHGRGEQDRRHRPPRPRLVRQPQRPRRRGEGEHADDTRLQGESGHRGPRPGRGEQQHRRPPQRGPRHDQGGPQRLPQRAPDRHRGGELPGRIVQQDRQAQPARQRRAPQPPTAGKAVPGVAHGPAAAR